MVVKMRSDSNPNVTYHTDPATGTCTCPAGQSGRRCKHLRRVEFLAAYKEARRALVLSCRASNEEMVDAIYRQFVLDFGKRGTLGAAQDKAIGEILRWAEEVRC